MNTSTSNAITLRISIAFLAFSHYLSWMFEGGRTFSSLHTQTVASLGVTLLVVSLARSLLASRDTERPGACDDMELFLYQMFVWVALLSAFRYFGERSHVNLLAGIGLATTVTAFLVRHGTLRVTSKVVVDCMLVLLAGVFFRSVSIERFAFGRNSDMLVLVSEAITAFLAGEPPYQVYELVQHRRGYFVPLTYLPVKWLSYLPAHLLHCDLRWTNVVLEACTYSLGIGMLLRCRHRKPEVLLLGAAALHVYFLNGYFMHRIDTEIPVYCFLLAVIFVLFQARREVAGYLALGVALATSQLTLLILPFFVPRTIRKTNLRRAVFLLTISVGLAALLVVPFVLQSPEGFKAGLVDHWEKVAGRGYTWAKRQILNLNFSVHFYKYDLTWVLKYLQAAICATLWGLFLWRKGYRRDADVWSFCMLTTFSFLMFNVVVWTYLFQPVVLLAVFSIITWKCAELEQTAATVPAQAALDM